MRPAHTFLKQASELTDYISCYLSTGPVKREGWRESPYATAPGSLLDSSLFGVGEMANHALGMPGDEALRRALLRRAVGQSKNRSYIDAFGRGITKSLPAAGLVAALTGGATGIATGLSAGQTMPVSQAILVGLLTGGLTGGLAGVGTAATGGLIGAYDRAILGNVDGEHVDDSVELKSKHPYLTSLPFGEVIGSLK